MVTSNFSSIILILAAWLVKEIEMSNLNGDEEIVTGLVANKKNISNEMVFQSYPQFQFEKGNH